MFNKSKMVKLMCIGLGLIFFIVCFLFIFKKPFLGQKMTVDYVNNSKFEIKNCRRDLGYLQTLMGVYDNVAYSMNFPIFENRKWNGVLFDEINSKIYRYKRSCLHESLINDKFELYSNYQTFKVGNNEENVSIQMQFYEKNLTKKTNAELVKTFVFCGDKLIDENRFFKRSEIKKIVDEIRNAFIAKFPKFRNSNLSAVLPYTLKTLHNFVLTDDSVVFFFDRGRILPEKYGIISVEVENVKLKHFVHYSGSHSNKLSNKDKSKPSVALTFDDGPDGEKTNELLEILRENDARATFFVLGRQAQKYPELLKKMVDYDCEIGNHTYSHPNLNSLSEFKFHEEIDKTNEIIEKATNGYRASLMRPPGNNCNNKVKNKLKQPIIQWSIDTLDWKHRNASKTIETVLSRVNDGSIILMHDIHKESIEAAKVLIPKLIEQGYNLVTVSELAEIKGESLNPHTKYTRIRSAS